MYRVSILSVITASLLFIGCSDEVKVEDKVKENKTLYIKKELIQTVEQNETVKTKEIVEKNETQKPKELKVVSNTIAPSKENIVSIDKLKVELEIQKDQLKADKLVFEKEKQLLTKAKKELALGVQAIINAKDSVAKEKELLSKIIKTTPVVTVTPVTEVTSTVTPTVAVVPVVSVTSVEKIIVSKPVTPIVPIEIKVINKSEDDTAFDYKLQAKKVSENVWCFFGAIEGPTKENAGNMVNSCYIKTKEGYLVMDTGPSYQFAKQSYEVMQKIEKLPVKYVVNSHEHDDHWLGNDFYKQKFGTYLIGPESININYKDGDKTRMYNVLPANAIEGTRIIKLDKTPKKPYTLSIGGEEFRIIPMDTKAHTGDDIFIYMPKRKVLFAGDLVMNGRITSNRHGSVIGQIKALAMMKKLDWDVMIPGHGFITDATAMDEAELYFKLTKQRVLEAIEEGLDATQINEAVKLIEFKDKAMYDILNPQNIAVAFEELEMLEDE